MSKRFALICVLSLAAASAHAAPSVPKITDVAFSGDANAYTVTITGKGFGVAPADIPCTACTPDELQIVDVVSQPLRLTINVTSWSDTSITATAVPVGKHNSLRIGVYTRRSAMSEPGPGRRRAARTARRRSARSRRRAMARASSSSSPAAASATRRRTSATTRARRSTSSPTGTPRFRAATASRGTRASAAPTTATRCWST